MNYGNYYFTFCLDTKSNKKVKASEKFAETCGGLELKV
jgi:hypothetical protein